MKRRAAAVFARLSHPVRADASRQTRIHPPDGQAAQIVATPWRQSACQKPDATIASMKIARHHSDILDINYPHGGRPYVDNAVLVL
jgi:hypothetical protein